MVAIFRLTSLIAGGFPLSFLITLYVSIARGSPFRSIPPNRLTSAPDYDILATTRYRTHWVRIKGIDLLSRIFDDVSPIVWTRTPLAEWVYIFILRR